MNEQTEGNKLIAEFAGWQHSDDPDFDKYEMENLAYHSNWSWLMPVVQKIGKMYDPYKYKAFENKEDAWDIVDLTIMNPINEVYNSVIQFIEWYNSQTLKP